MKKDPFHLISPTTPHHQQTQPPAPPDEYGREVGNAYQFGAPPPRSMQQGEIIELGEDGEDSEFQIAMTNLANAKSRYLGSKPPPPPPSSSKPSRGRMHPQPLPPIPQNVILKKVPVQHRNIADPVCDAGQFRSQEPAEVALRHPMSSGHAAKPIRAVDPVESAFSERPPSMAFSPLQLAKLPDFNFDDENEPTVGNKFRVSQFYPTQNQSITEEPDLRQPEYDEQEQPHMSSSSSDQQVKVAMLPPTKPSAVCARRQQKSQFNYTTTNANRNSQYNNNNSGNLPENYPAGPSARYGPMYDARGADERAYPVANSSQSLVGSFTSSMASQTQLNAAMGRNQNDNRFIPVHEITSFKGLVKRPSRFVGQMWKLGRNKRWQRRTFTIDHSFFVCFKNGNVTNTCAMASREPGTPPEITNHLTWDDLRNRKTCNENRIIKWILPLEQLDGLYLWKKRDSDFNDEGDLSILDKVVHKLKKFLFNPCSPSRLIDSASMVKTEIDIGEQYEWIDVLDKFRAQRKVSMEEMKKKVRECSDCFILLTTTTGHFHLLRTKNEYELFNWCMLLTAKRVLLGN